MAEPDRCPRCRKELVVHGSILANKEVKRRLGLETAE
jgi:hypothetical protein